jgi:hypothetical protein
MPDKLLRPKCLGHDVYNVVSMGMLLGLVRAMPQRAAVLVTLRDVYTGMCTSAGAWREADALGVGPDSR